VLEEEAVLVDLHVKKVEEPLSRDNIVQEGTVDFCLIVVQIPLLPLLVDLLYHSQGDTVLFSDAIRSPPVIKQVSVSALFTMKVRELTDALRKRNGPAFLLE
jgi:hypothetical protein